MLAKGYKMCSLASLYECVSDTGELKYRLRVVYNFSNLVPKTVLVS